VLVTQEDDGALKSLVTQYISKAKLPAPKFLAANAEPKDCWNNILEWLSANPTSAVITDTDVDFDVTAELTPIAAPPEIASSATLAPKAPIADAPQAVVANAAQPLAVPAPSVATAVAITPSSIKEPLELEGIFNAAATLSGFRFAAVVDTQSAMRSSARAFAAATPDDNASFAAALPLIQEWVTLGAHEFVADGVNKTIYSLAISATHVCRFAYKLNNASSYVLVFELESKHSNIALTNILVDEMRDALILG
jgi:hypothetical protein